MLRSKGAENEEVRSAHRRDSRASGLSQVCNRSVGLQDCSKKHANVRADLIHALGAGDARIDGLASGKSFFQ